VGRSRISGGPGNDEIEGSRRSDVIDPGAGIDSVIGGEVINTRDGEIDYLSCNDKDTAYIDGFDEWPDFCGEMHRRGSPRVIPSQISPVTAYGDVNWGSVGLTCPADGPLACAGSVTVTRGKRVFVRKRFRFSRSERRYSGNGGVGFPATDKEIRAMQGELRITVRTRGSGGGKVRTASGIYKLNQ
jgi:hypothetical protein